MPACVLIVRTRSGSSRLAARSSTCAGAPSANPRSGNILRCQSQTARDTNLITTTDAACSAGLQACHVVTRGLGGLSGRWANQSSKRRSDDFGDPAERVSPTLRQFASQLLLGVLVQRWRRLALTTNACFCARVSCFTTYSRANAFPTDRNAS